MCRRRAIESSLHGDLRSAPGSQSNGEDRFLVIARARHQNILNLWGQHGESVCWADILRQENQAWFPRSACLIDCCEPGLCSLSLEFPSVACSSTFYSSWFIPTDWSVRAKGGSITFYSNRCDSFKQNTPPPLPVHPLFTSQPFSFQIELIFACMLF